MGQDCLQQRQGGGGVVAKKYFRPQHGLPGFNQGGKVKHGVEGLSLVFGGDEKVFNRGPLCQLPLHKFHPCRQQIASSVTQVVINHHPVFRFGKKSRYCTTYVPRPACNQYLHKNTPLPE